jgi:hypothetical protein
MTLEMFDHAAASPSVDESAPKSGVQPELAWRGSSGPAGLPDTLGASSGMSSGVGSERLPALVARTSISRRAVRVLPVGILLYLLSIGVVATATIGVFFGIGFFLLAQSTEAMNSNAGVGEPGSFANRLPRILRNASSTYGDIGSVSIEAQIPRSTATATLPAVPFAPPTGKPSAVGSVPASDAKDPSFGKGAPGSEVREAYPPEPAPTSLAAAPEREETSRLSSAQVTELLSRGDSFLHAGDVASARLFYERAADAGDWQAAIRMGATFDPAFLARAGVRAGGDPAQAQSWYRHALDLGAPKTDRQAESPKTK